MLQNLKEFKNNLSDTTKAQLGLPGYDKRLVTINEESDDDDADMGAAGGSSSGLPRVGGGGATSSRAFQAPPASSLSGMGAAGGSSSGLPRVGGGGATSSRAFQAPPASSLSGMGAAGGSSSGLVRVGGGGATSSRAFQAPLLAQDKGKKPIDDEVIIIEDSETSSVLGKREREVLECALCFEKERDTAYLPCNHFAACSECAEKCKEQCPFCRQPVTGTMKLRVV